MQTEGVKVPVSSLDVGTTFVRTSQLPATFGVYNGFAPSPNNEQVLITDLESGEWTITSPSEEVLPYPLKAVPVE